MTVEDLKNLIKDLDNNIKIVTPNGGQELDLRLADIRGRYYLIADADTCACCQEYIDDEDDDGMTVPS